MKIKGLENKIYRLNPNSINFNVSKLSKLKEGGIVDLPKEDADDLINKGMAKLVKSSKKGEK
tara:strand:+ start:407 stop:592 length:186 start_codon:yes stop_codon:yes gene_type:complete